MNFGTDRPIKIWAYDSYVEIANQAAAAYADNYPDTYFEVERKTAEEILDAIKNPEQVSETSPDIVLMHDMELKQRLGYFPELFLNLSDYQIDETDFKPYASANVKYDDKLYGVPVAGMPVAFYYRQDLLNSLGIEISEPPYTWEELIVIGETVREKAPSKTLLPYTKELVQTLMQSTGRGYYNESGEIEPTNIMEILEFLNGLKQSGVFGNQAISYDELLPALADGTYLAFIGPSYLYNSIQDLQDFQQEWRMTRLPTSGIFTEQVSLGGNVWMVVDKSKYGDQSIAVDFLRAMFVETEETFVRLAEDGRVPVIASAENLLNDLPLSGCFGGQNVIQELTQLGNVIPEIPFGRYTWKITEKLTDIGQKVMSGEFSVEVGNNIFLDSCASMNYDDSDGTAVRVLFLNIEQPPAKTRYYRYEAFDPTGMVVKAGFSDGSYRVVDNFHCSPDVMKQSGEETVTIAYSCGGFTATEELTVSVEDREIVRIEAKVLPALFLHGNPLPRQYVSVKAYYDRGEPNYVYDFSISPNVLSSAGQTTITVTYEEFSCETTVLVTAQLESIRVKTPPEKRTYFRGESFNKSGMEVEARYSDGTTRSLSAGSINVPNSTVKFENGAETANVELTYTLYGKTARTQTTVYRKTGADLDDCEITQDMGSSGCGTVNLRYGKMTYLFEDFSGTDQNMPIHIRRIYQYDLGNSYGVGENWRLNLHQELRRRNDKWVYLDQEGKEYSFENGYPEEEERSTVRNEKLGMDLFDDSGNYRITLVDRSNNSLVFNLISGIYRLTEVHRFPSKQDSPIDAHCLKIEYSQNGKITAVKAGRRVSGKQPCVKFHYTGGLLTELIYCSSEESTVVAYEYEQNVLSKITQCDGSVNEPCSHVTSFIYSANSFEVVDEASKDSDGNCRSLSYSMGDDGVVSWFSIGYGTDDRDETTIDYSNVYAEGGVGDIHTSAKLIHKNMVSIISFNKFGEAARYGYEKSDANDPGVIKKVHAAQSRGFDYQSLAANYSDTLDLYHSNFADGADGWSSGGSDSIKTVNGEASLKANAETVSRSFSFGDSLGEGTTVYLSLWVYSESQPGVTVKLASNGQAAEITHLLDNRLGRQWQYTALCLGKRTKDETITVTVHGKELRLYDVRLTRAPYETPENISDTEYNAFGNVTKAYRYNPVDGSISCTKYSYNSDHQIVEQTEMSNGRQISRTEYGYTDGELTSTRVYGKIDANYTEEGETYSEEHVLIESRDANRVRTVYSEGSDWVKVVSVGETASPDIETKNTFYTDSGFLKEVSGGGCINSLFYDANGTLKKVGYGYQTSDEHSEIGFAYDSYGNLREASIGEGKLLTLNYNSRQLESAVYGNGDRIEYTYDENERMVSVAENGENSVSIIYGDDAEDTVTVEHTNGLRYISKAVNREGITGRYEAEISGTEHKLKVEGRAANAAGNETTVDYFLDGGSVPFERCIAIKNAEGQLEWLKRKHHGGSNYYSYNEQNRLVRKETTYPAEGIYEVSYEYQVLSGERIANRICGETFRVNGSKKDGIRYEYYANGNLARVYQDEKLRKEYAYDESGRLKEEKNYELGEVSRFTYDSGNNVTEKKRFRIENGRVSTTPYQTDTYDYEAGSGQNGAWKDQLKSYNGQTIEYDGAGNPTSYLGKALTWKGRKLTGIAGLGMEYDYKGYRIKKGNKRYIWQEDRLIAEVEADEGEESFIYYYYDESGVSGMNVNGSEYYYRKNLQGDVIAVYDDNGHMECRYDYDAWGRHRCRLENGTVIYDSATGAVSGYEEHIGIRNAIRYRSYYWDSETGLYYLQSRYYDPEIGRFISPDEIEYLEPESIGGLNLYAYCANDPVMNIDPSGHFAISTFLISLAIGSLISWGLSEIFGAQIAGGIGSVAGGGTAISTGISLMAFGPWGIVAGAALIAVGAATAAFGTNEIIAGATGINYIQSWTGMSDGLYNGLYTGLNIASSIGSIAGNLGMRYASNKILNGIIKNPQSVQQYKLWQMKTFGKYNSKFFVGTLKRGDHFGQGYTLTNKINPSNGYIQWHPGSRHHFDGVPYWKVTSGLYGSWRGLYLF